MRYLTKEQYLLLNAENNSPEKDELKVYFMLLFLESLRIYKSGEYKYDEAKNTISVKGNYAFTIAEMKDICMSVALQFIEQQKIGVYSFLCEGVYIECSKGGVVFHWV